MSQILSLICNENHSILDDRFLKQILSSNEFKNVNTLAPHVAISLPLDNQERRSTLQKELASHPIDINIIPSMALTPKRLLIADMDSTMIEQECIDELAKYAGKYDAIYEITERAMRGELDFEAALKERVAMLQGLAENIIDNTYSDNISYTSGGFTLIKTMKQYNAYTALVSGGFTHFTKQVAKKLGFDHQEANTLIIENNEISGKVKMPILGRQAKATALKTLCARHNIDIRETLAVGDGANDLDMLQLADMGVAFHAKPLTAKAATYQINHANLEALLYLQNIPKSEHVLN